MFSDGTRGEQSDHREEWERTDTRDASGVERLFVEATNLNPGKFVSQIFREIATAPEIHVILRLPQSDALLLG